MKTLHRRNDWLCGVLITSLWLVRGMFAAFAFLVCLCGAVQAQTYFSGTPKTIDNGVNDGGVGQYDSQAIVNGNPAISYYDATNRDLKYVRADDADGTSWGTPLTIDSGGDVGKYTSLEVVNGYPAISYYDVTNTNLKYARALDADGASWGMPITINPPGNVGSMSSLEVVNGRPAISYYDAANGDLIYIRATETDGTALPWGTPLTIDSVGTTGQYTSLEVVDGNPAIAFYHSSGGNLRYVRANDPSGIGWGAPVTVVSNGTTGLKPSLAVVNGNPAISYFHANAFSLRYVRATSTDGSTWGTSFQLDAGNVGNTSSLAVVNGNPAISYVDGTNSNLKYVRANDANGATAAAWGARITIDSDGVVGADPSLVIVNGKPAVSYSGNGNLQFIRATGANGTSWQTPVTVDQGSGGNVGRNTSLAVVNGNPAVSYYDVTELNLRYVRALDASGTDWDMPVLIETAGSVGQYTSLKVISGNPAVSYYDATNHDLKYVRANDSDGTSWGMPLTIDSVGDVGQYTSLGIVDGNPAICYYDLTNGDLKYVRATGTDGTTLPWATPVTIDSVGDVGQFSSLKVVGGNPAISYYDVSNLDLKYVRADSPDGTSWSTLPVTIDAVGNVGQFPSLEVVSGNPAISYYDATNTGLKYVRALTAEGASISEWGMPLSLDATGSVGQYSSLLVVNGKPAISYYDSTNGNLKYARALTGEGLTIADWGAKVTIDATGTIGQYTSLAVIDCNAAVSYYNVTNGDLKYVRSNPIWDGELSVDWHTGTNWAFGCVPASGDSVVLPNSGVINEAVISNDDVIVNDLSLGTNRTVLVSGNRTLTITGVLTMNGGNITVEPGSKIVLGCNASVVGASATDFIVGDVRKEFCDLESFTFPIGEMTGTAEYSPMTAAITAGTFPPTAATPPSLTVSVSDTWLPGLLQSSSVSRYWKVNESGDLTADMTFAYLTADINGSESSYKVFKRESGSPTEVTPNSNNPDENTATVVNVSNFSDWGIGLPAPTGASVSVSGRIFTAEGFGVSRVSVSLTGPHGQPRTTLSSSFGYYRFDDVEVGETYVLSVSSKRYQFTPLAVTVLDTTENLNLTAQQLVLKR